MKFCLISNKLQFLKSAVEFPFRNYVFTFVLCLRQTCYSVLAKCYRIAQESYYFKELYCFKVKAFESVYACLQLGAYNDFSTEL